MACGVMLVAAAVGRQDVFCAQRMNLSVMQLLPIARSAHTLAQRVAHARVELMRSQRLATKVELAAEVASLTVLAQTMFH
mmetsp:Transcript_25317/g.81854  ORF Transcript_25317/g.81854 Transcript_25317/m.81854 type:complete len:80 (+) Transcript_25317:278-517(+)